MKRFLCFVGLHIWRQNRPLSAYDGWPAPFDNTYQTPERMCERCDRKERWLPGYGGSEWGCWLKVMEAKDG